jgi:hypothetical protein
MFKSYSYNCNAEQEEITFVYHWYLLLFYDTFQHLENTTNRSLSVYVQNRIVWQFKESRNLDSFS